MRRADMLAMSVCFWLMTTSAAAQPTASFHSGMDGGTQTGTRFANAGITTSFSSRSDGDLGVSLAYLIRAELESVLGPPPQRYALQYADFSATGELDDRAEKKYHVAAQNVADEHQAPLALWGVVREREGRVIIHSFLTLQPSLRETDLVLRVNLNAPQDATFQAAITRTRYGFSVVNKHREALFQRTLSVASNTDIFTHASVGSAPVGSLTVGEALDGLSLHGAWYYVKTSDGRMGYVDIAALKVLPRAISARTDQVVVRDSPDARRQGREITAEVADFRVVDIQHDDAGVPWYRVANTRTEGWVSGDDVRPQLSLPVSHFLLGLYYFRAPRNAGICAFDLASHAFADFIAVSADKGKNTNLASAQQFFAASKLLDEDDCDKDPQPAIAAYDASVSLTPYDPTAYNLRAVAGLGVAETKEQVVMDLQRAFTLDVQNEETRQAVEAMQTAINQDALNVSEEVSQHVARLYNAIKREQVSRHVTRIRRAYHLPMKSKGRKVTPTPPMGVILTFRNRTGVPLDLYVLKDTSDKEAEPQASPRSLYVALSNGEETKLRLDEGAYQIAAEALDPTVKPLFGEHTYASQSHYEVDFEVELKGTPLEKR